MTATLWIIAGGAIPPLFVFKGQPAGRVGNKITKHLFVKFKQVFSFSQTNSCNSQIITKKGVSKYGGSILI